MKKRKLISVGAALLISTGLLTGCGNSGATPATETKQSPAMEQIALEEQVIPEDKIYAPYEHVFFKRYYTTPNTYAEKVLGGQIEVPEGYEILEIENFTEKLGYGSQTAGFDVWFINTKQVKVKAIYNEVFGYYDYSEPGIAQELSLEEESLTLKKTR